MGLGRFGVAGCCKCAPGTDPGTVSETAGPCGWCGYYDPNERDLEMPVPPSKLCYAQVFDTFSYSKDYPRVPYWTFQRDIHRDPAHIEDWQDNWLYGDYHHLNGGHFVTSSRERYQLAPPSGWRYVTGRKVDTLCPNPATGSTDDERWARALVNIPPGYGSYYYGYPYTKRYENGLIINSQTNKTDLIPLLENVSLQFNTPIDQWPRYLWFYSEGNPPIPGGLCFEEPCPGWEMAVAVQYTSLTGDDTSLTCGYYGSLATQVFGWNHPGQDASSGSSYGLWVRHFRVTSSAVAPVGRVRGDSFLEPYLPTEQTVEIHYWVGWPNGLSTGINDGDGYRTVYLPYKDSVNLKIEVQFDNYPGDNRKCFLTVSFLVDGYPVFSQRHLIAKPGWRQDGSSTDEQSFIQSFCPSQINACNHITGINANKGSTAPWYYEIIAMWGADQTPRESWWIDSWFAEYRRL